MYDSKFNSALVIPYPVSLGEPVTLYPIRFVAPRKEEARWYSPSPPRTHHNRRNTSNGIGCRYQRPDRRNEGGTSIGPAGGTVDLGVGRRYVGEPKQKLLLPSGNRLWLVLGLKCRKESCGEPTSRASRMSQCGGGIWRIRQWREHGGIPSPVGSTEGVLGGSAANGPPTSVHKKK